MDWNNDGKIGMDDLILTEIILEDEEEGEDHKGGVNKPNGSCLSSFLLLLIPPVVLIIGICSFIGRLCLLIMKQK